MHSAGLRRRRSTWTSWASSWRRCSRRYGEREAAGQLTSAGGAGRVGGWGVE